MRWESIQQLKKEAEGKILSGSVFCQMTQKSEKLTKTGKPYLELQFADAQSNMTIKIWDNAPWYDACMQYELPAFLELQGSWQMGNYGMEASELSLRALNETEREQLLSGNPSAMEKQQTDWDYILQNIDAMHDPRLRFLCRALVDSFGERFRRAAAARHFHHARRGGLVEHVAGMMRAASALCSVYPHINQDLVLSGVLFHDSGKMWENQYEEQGFEMPYSEFSELLGHIPIGMEIINRLWGFIMTPERKEEWSKLQPHTDRVRLHLMHLVASHHGELSFGSPVVPKTPEAILLHYVDNLDAKLEMFSDAYENSNQLAPRVYAKRAPLGGNEVAPLPPLS